MCAVPNKCDVEGRLGRYELLEELGRGAMGVVYKARDPQIDRLVAIKTICSLAEDFELEDACRTRFVIEAKAAGRLSHRGIVQVFDVGEELISQIPYIVMEYVPGTSLNKMLAHGAQLPVNSALQLVQEIAEALAYAHGQGVIHRDIKPSNVIVTEGGHAKITDFGVSKLDFGNGTAGGQILGTPAYMAPEQLSNSSQADGRSDLFSVGVLLYCMLSGHRPFQGNSPKTVAFKIAHQNPVPVTALKLGLPADINYVLARAMAKVPAQRYQTGTEMALDLGDVRDQKRPRSCLDVAGTDAVNQSPVLERRSFQGSIDIASASHPANSQLAATADTSAPQRVFFNGVSTLASNVGVWAVVIIAIAVSYLGMRRLPGITSAPRSATTAAETLSASVATHNASIGDATPSSRSAALHSAAVAVPQPKRKLDRLASTARTQVPTASMQVVVDHEFELARISLWIDDRLAYTGSLRGEVNKRLGVFRKVRGEQSRILELTPGPHQLRVRVESAAGGYDQEESISGVFEKGVRRILRIKCDKRGRLQLGLA